MSDDAPEAPPPSLPGLSIEDELSLLTDEERDAWIADLNPDELDALMARDWSVVARPEQFLPDGHDWLVWLIRAGRGWGKTRTGAEATKESIRELAAEATDPIRWALVAPRREDVLTIQFEGESGLASVLPPSMLLGGSWDRSFNKGELTLTLDGGHSIRGFSGRTPSALRGPQHHGAWIDEPATLPDAHRGLDEDTAVSNLLLGLRLQPWNRLIITGTPRNVRLIKDLRALPGLIETVGRTRDNLANLSELFKAVVIARYAGTRLGRQELDAELLEGVGVMFARGWFRRGAPEWPRDATIRRLRYWDLASGEESEANPDPDWTVGALVAFDPDRRLYRIEHLERFRLSPGARETRIRAIAKADGLPVVWIEKEPGNAGKAQLHMLGRELDGIAAVRGNPVSGPKTVRAELLATAAEQGRVTIPDDAAWVERFLDEAEEFPEGPHDDQVDAVAGAFQMLRESGPAKVEARPAAVPDLPRPGAQRRQAVPGRAPAQAGDLRLGRGSRRGPGARS
jgi:predicted phage terminase large subunit-like protein